MSPPDVSEDDEHLWVVLIETSRQYIKARMALFASGADVLALVKRGLRKPGERYDALVVGALLDEVKRRELFPDLIDLLAWDNGFASRTYEVIDSLDRQWVLDHLPAETQRVLDHYARSPNGSSWEEYAGMAGLLARYQSPYLVEVLNQASVHSDEDIREVAAHYRQQN